MGFYFLEREVMVPPFFVIEFFGLLGFSDGWSQLNKLRYSDELSEPERGGR